MEAIPFLRSLWGWGKGKVREGELELIGKVLKQYMTRRIYHIEKEGLLFFILKKNIGINIIANFPLEVNL